MSIFIILRLQSVICVHPVLLLLNSSWFDRSPLHDVTAKLYFYKEVKQSSNAESKSHDLLHVSTHEVTRFITLQAALYNNLHQFLNVFVTQFYLFILPILKWLQSYSLIQFSNFNRNSNFNRLQSVRVFVFVSDGRMKNFNTAYRNSLRWFLVVKVCYIPVNEN